MPTATANYAGALHTEARHTESGAVVYTDAPKDNNGNGESFSPTDLTAVSLLTCMLTMMGIAARKNAIAFERAQGAVTKHMAAGPRRIHVLEIQIDMASANYSATERRILEEAALNCPVAKSLHPEIEQRVQFSYA